MGKRDISGNYVAFLFPKIKKLSPSHNPRDNRVGLPEISNFILVLILLCLYADMTLTQSWLSGRENNLCKISLLISGSKIKFI